MTSQNNFITKAAKVANFTLIAGACASLLALGYFLYHYTWLKDRQFTSWLGVFLYYGLPAAATLLLLAALRLKPHHKINLVLAGLSVFVAICAAELALTLTAAPPMVTLNSVRDAVESARDRKKAAAEIGARLGVEFDVRDRFEVVTDLRRKGIEAVPFVIPRLQIEHQKDESRDHLFALGGISNRMTVICNESGQFITYESDEHGFRNPRGMWNSEQIEIVAVGDSYTQGYCVPSEQSFVGVIRRQYPATLNLGMAGADPLLMLAAVTEYASRFRPRLVLWFYFEGNDLPDMHHTKSSRVLVRYLEDDFSQALLERQAEIHQLLVEYVEKEIAREIAWREGNRGNKILGALMGLRKLSALRARLGLVAGTGVEESASATEADDENMSLFREILSKAKARVSAWGGTLYFVYLPSWPRDGIRLEGGQGMPRCSSPCQGEKQRANVLRIVGDLDLPVIDILPAFQAESDALSLVPLRLAQTHYNEKGHQLVADEVLRAIGPRAQAPTASAPMQNSPR